MTGLVLWIPWTFGVVCFMSFVGFVSFMLFEASTHDDGDLTRCDDSTERPSRRAPASSPGTLAAGQMVAVPHPDDQAFAGEVVSLRGRR